MRILLCGIFLFTGLFISGCVKSNDSAGGTVLARVNNYKITQDEFEEEFRSSAYYANDTLQSRKNFLNLLINRKLIMQDAQKKGLDKDRDFLKMIQRFWEQSLLQRAFEAKNRSLDAQVSDNKSQDILRQKKADLMDAWIDDLRKQASISINENLLIGNK
ncbi:MAG: SurA N-terminal domain-containing protein [Candidatus Omnitrophica bacterium]|jgi:hypothetical protein|nr:SurA N-terminal domain-containing protein [Candidatus Omnitrophota bacterium]